MHHRQAFKISKILVIVYMILTFVSILMPDSFLLGLREFDNLKLPYPDPFQMIMRWAHLVGFVVLPIAVFFDRPTFKKLSIYFCLPVAIVFAFMFKELLSYFTSDYGTGICDIRYLPPAVEAFMKNGVFRGLLFFAIIATELASIVFAFLRDTSVWKFNVKDILPFVIILLACIATIMPVYALEGIFHTWLNEYPFSLGKPMHLIWLVFMVAEFTLFTIFFKKRSMEDRYILVLILSLSLLLQFNQLFSSLGELTCKRMPFQLCNIAAYTIFISVATKKRGIFLFNILINVAGGIIAAIVMDVENNGILNKSNVHYIVEHNNVIVAPLLCLSLGIFKPIEKKDFLTFTLYFTGYYLFVFVLGTIFNGLYKSTGDGFFFCNYLFMFDQATAARLLPFAGELFNIKVSLGSATLYPVIQALIYVAFFTIGTIAFFILKATIKEKKNKEAFEVESIESLQET